MVKVDSKRAEESKTEIGSVSNFFPKNHLNFQATLEIFLGHPVNSTERKSINGVGINGK